MIWAAPVALMALALVALCKLVRHGKSAPVPDQNAFEDAIRIRYPQLQTIGIVCVSECAILFDTEIGYLLASSDDGKVTVEPVSRSRVAKDSTTWQIVPDRPWRKRVLFQLEDGRPVVEDRYGV